MHSLQCTEKLDLQCSEEESKISASIIIQAIEQGFLTKSDSFKEICTFCKKKKKAFFPEADPSSLKRQP